MTQPIKCDKCNDRKQILVGYPMPNEWVPCPKCVNDTAPISKCVLCGFVEGHDRWCDLNPDNGQPIDYQCARVACAIPIPKGFGQCVDGTDGTRVGTNVASVEEWRRFFVTFLAQNVLPNPTEDLYSRIENWQRHFYKMSTEGRGAGDYYTSAASGMAIALQEIDKERFDRTGGDVWREYLELKKAADAKIEPQKRYVAGFLIDRWAHEIVLVEKNRPKWQEGYLNGVGGHIEEGETPQEAMRREFREETGHDRNDWELYTMLEGDGFIVYFFRAFDSMLRPLVRTMTDEEIKIISLDDVAVGICIPNLTWLVPMALSMDHDSADGFLVKEIK